MRLSALGLCLLFVLACARGTRPEYFATEASFFRVGVDRQAEEREVKRVLGQRKLDVTAELRSKDFVAFGASTLDSKVSAIRVITDRGVVIAEDAQLDDLFAPAQVAVLDEFPTRLNDLALVGFVRTPRNHDAGCVRLSRILPDGNVAQVLLDVSAFGSRACVLSLKPGPRGRLLAEVGSPDLTLGHTEPVRATLAFQTVPLGKGDPAVRVARAQRSSELIEAERQRLQAAHCEGAELAIRHGLGMARAALALFMGESKDRQIDAYRQCLGIVPPGTYEAEVVAATLLHIERGWLDAAPETSTEASKEAEVIVEPEHPGPDAVVIEPDEKATRE